MKHLDENVLILVLGLFTAAINLFAYCFFGKLTTDSYGGMAKSLFESNWQVLSLDLQKCYILMIGNAQKPLCYHGFRIAVLNLETFLKVNVVQ